MTRSVGMTHFESMWLIRLAALRARLGDDVAAEQLFADAIATRSQLVNPPALVGRAGAARRLGDFDSCRGWLDEAKAKYETRRAFPAAPHPALIGLAWWSLAVGDLTAADKLCRAGPPPGRQRPPIRWSASWLTTVAAAVVLASTDTKENRTRFAAILEQRAATGRSSRLPRGAPWTNPTSKRWRSPTDSVRA